MKESQARSKLTERRARGIFVVLNMLGLIMVLVGNVIKCDPVMATGLGMAFAADAAISLFI